MDVRAVVTGLKLPFSGNPLVRTGDRIAWVLGALLVLWVLLMIPVAGAVGTEVYVRGMASPLPRTTTVVVIEAVAAASTVLAITGVLAFVLRASYRVVATRQRFRAWDREWAAVDAEQSGKTG